MPNSTGRPTPFSETYWAIVRVGGAARDVLTQCFERRCLTYTPDNPEGWNVEAGNVGQHDHQWRYGTHEDRQQYAARAADADAAMQNCFYQPHVQLFSETCPNSGPNPYSYGWPFAQAFAASAALAGAAGDTADLPARVAGAERYWDAAASPPGYNSYVGSGDKFYDDNAWLGLALVQTYRLTGNRAALDQAGQVFDFIVAGWDTDPSHPAPGGVFWTQAGWSRDRNTVSNAPSAELGLLLAEQTADPAIRKQRIALARMLLDWVDANLRDADGLYRDHIGLDGQIDATKWTYNQGTMLGAYTLLYRVTGAADALARAETIAAAALARFDAAALDAQPAAFNAIFFRNLLLLASETRNLAYPDALRAYADHLWSDRRDSATNLATLSAPLTLLDQAALVEVNALLAWDPERWELLT